MYLSNNYHDYKHTVVLQKWTRHRVQPRGTESACCLCSQWNRNHSSTEALSASWIAVLVLRCACLLPTPTCLCLFPTATTPSQLVPFPICFFLRPPPMTFTRRLP